MKYIEYEYNGRIYAILPLTEMRKNVIYKGKCRNAEYAMWTGEKFVHLRKKFNFEFLEEIHHPENDYHFDVFMPFEIADTEALEVTRLNEKIEEQRQRPLKYEIAVVKFNNGNGALLCNKCNVIIAYGTEHEDKVHLCFKCEVKDE